MLFFSFCWCTRLNHWLWPLLLLPVVCLVSRRLWSVRRGPCGGSAGEIPVCFRGVREEPVSQPAQQVWEAVAPLAFPTHRLFFCHRATFLHPSGGQNPHRNSDKGHAAVREQLQLALHAYSIEEKLYNGAAKVRKRSHTSNQVISSTAA